MTLPLESVISMEYSRLFLAEQLEMLINNSIDKINHKNLIPVAYLSVDKLGYQFLITEIDKNQPTNAFGLIDYDTQLQIGFFNLEKVDMQARLNGVTLEPSFDFFGKYPLAVYAMAADSLKTLVVDNTEANFKRQFDCFSIPEYLDTSIDISFLKKKIGYMF